MAWSTRPFGFACCVVLLLNSACGEGVPSDPSGVPSAIAVTVLVPSGFDTPPDTGLAALTTSIEYTVDCLSRESVTSEGTLERTAEFEGADGRTAVWKGLVELVPGSCTIRLLARDDGGELICYSTEPLNIEPDMPSELYFEMGCYIFPCSDAVAQIYVAMPCTDGVTSP